MTATLDPAASSAPEDAGAATFRRPWRPTPERASLLVLLGLTALGYLWTLSESGYANQFYAAAAQAGGQSWKAWFFGSLDIGNAITVDKPPASLWVMGLSVRLFGLSSWSILVSQALMGVATVGLTFALVRKVAPWPAAIAAGALTALTPAAALMFRFDNPDALLVLLLVGAGFCTVRAIETGKARWLVLAGVLLGFGFLTKMLQAFLIIPAIAAVYLIAGPGSFLKRVLHGVYCFGAMLLAAGWWIAIFELVPESWRPYMDGSQNNSVLELALGYNGIGRINGGDYGGLGNAGFGSAAGILRLFQGVSGGMITWLLPAALILLVAALVWLRKAPRTDLTRATLLLTGGSMLVTGLVFSFMGGIYHDYYVVALAPWIAATAVIGAAVVWRDRAGVAARIVLAVTLVASAAWAWVLLGQSDQQPYATLRWFVLILGLVAAAGLTVVDRLDRLERLGRWSAVAVLAATAVSVGIGPAAYAIQTIGTPHTGSIVTAGPYSGGGPGGLGGPGGPVRMRGGPGGQAMPAMPGGQNGGPSNGQNGGQGPELVRLGGGGGMFGGDEISDELAEALRTNAGAYRWAAATTSSTSAASYQLGSGESVMSIGGFNGSAPSITLKQFQEYVADGQIHYYIAGGGPGGMGTFELPAGMELPGNAQMPAGGQAGPGNRESSVSTEISSWVEENFTSTDIDGTTVYDLTQPKAGA
ncbi:glycosyltransferase family 39 protein [Nocardioides sp. NPDC051685]|uniref:glycosyltransferase family 39 protein n=1 Tax=Nocardioides sp. NPDC051685 TaxID=3364334 RepID=UPI00378AC5A1